MWGKRTCVARITRADGSPVTGYDVAHDKRMHLILVRSDTADFQHLHPVMDPDGTWRTPVTLAGAALQAATGSFDLADVLRDLGSPGIAYLFVAVGFTGSVLTNIWSGGLSLTDVAPGIPHAAALVGVTVVGGIVAAGGLADHMLPWLTVMALAAPGLVAVCAIHALRGGPAIAGWGTTGLCCWGAGFGCGIALHLAGSGLALPAAAAVPAIGYWWFGPTEERNLADANAGG